MIRRTQLNRAPVKILGEPSNDEVGVSQDMENDSHLKDFNVEIFDDSDFYHQVSGLHLTFNLAVLINFTNKTVAVT